MTNPPTDDPLATLERLLKEATPGPWGMPDRAEGLVSAGDVHSGWSGMIARVDAGDYARSRSEGIANAALIAHLRNLAPALVEVVKAAKEDLAARNTGDPDWSLAREARANNALVAALRALEVKP